MKPFEFNRSRKRAFASNRFHFLASLLIAFCSFVFNPCTSLANDFVALHPQSQLQFITRFEGEEAPGLFKRFEAEVITDPETSQPQSIRVKVDVTSASMGSPDLDEGIAGPEWFDFSSHPQATFISDEIEPASGAGYVAQGVLQIKGVEQKLTLAFDWQQQEEKAFLSGEAELSRLAFQIGSGEWSDTTSIADEVLVSFSLSLAEAPQ